MKKIFQVLVPLAIGIGVLLYFLSGFTREQYEEVGNSFARSNKLLLLLSVFLGLISHIIRGVRWKILLEPFSGKTLKYGNLILSVGVSYLVNLGIPRSGEISRALLVVKYEKLPFAQVMGTIIAERIIDVLILGLIILFTFFLEFDVIYSLVASFFPHISIVEFIFLSLFTIILFIVTFFFLLRSSHPFSKKIKDFFRQIIEGVLSIRKAENLKLFWLETFLIWLLYLLMLYVVMLAFDETSGLGFGAVLSAFVAGSLSIVLSNGGIGTYPVFVTEILMLYGVSKEAGFAFSLTMWTAQTLILIVFGLVSFILLPLFNRNDSIRGSNA